MKGEVSQAGEYSTLRRLIKNDFPRYLVDIGAGDGISLSNSYGFIKSGWHAIMVEPHPYPFDLLSKRYINSKRVSCVKKACSNETGLKEFFLGKDQFTSTLCRDRNKWFEEVKTGESIIIETDTLTNILIENKYPRDFSLLLIDAEAMDYEVLLGLDFNLFQPRIILTEEYKWNIQKHYAKYRLLSKLGYILHNHIGCNTIWIRR